MKKNFTLLFSLCIFVAVQGYGQNYLFGGPGSADGEFDGGLNNWTTTGMSTGDTGLEEDADAVWIWKSNATPDQGAYAANVQQISSPSAANGAAILDSDYYDTNGTQGAFGTGIAPAPQLVYLTSPLVDCSTAANVYLTFNQQYRNFSATTYVEVSGDGGTTWETFNINGNIPSNQSTITFWEDVQIIDVSSVAANNATVQFRFTWDGDFYYWVVDDVALIDALPGEVKLSEYYYAPKNYATPVDQINGDSLHFIAEVINYGSVTAEGVEVTVDVTTNGGASKHTETVTVDIEANDTLAVVFPTSLEYEKSTFPVGEYRVDYTAASATDLFAANNSRGRGFAVTQDLYSKGASKTWYYNWGSASGFGNIYRTGEWDSDLGDFFGTGVVFSGASNDGTVTENFRVRLYQISDDVNKNLDEFDVDSAPQFEISDPPHPNMVIRGFNNESLSGAPNFSDFTSFLIDLEEPDYDGVLLEPNAQYMLFLYWENGTFAGVDERYPNSWFGDHFANGPFQVSSLIFSDTWFYSAEPTLRAFHINMQTVFVSGVEDVQLAEGALSVSPNPASDIVNIELDLANTTNAMLLLTDINGQVIEFEPMNDVQNAQTQFNVSNLTNGTYVVKLVTLEGVKAHKIVVAH